MFEQNQETNQEQINEEKLNALKEELNQPLEDSDNFSEQEPLELPDSATASKKKKTVTIIAIVLGVILISGGLLFAADRFWGIEIPFVSKLFKIETSENITAQPGIEEPPEDVIRKMFSSFKNIKTSQDSFDLKITEKNKDGNDKVANFIIEGKRDLSATEKPKFDYTLKFNQPSSDVNISLVFRYIGEKMYIKLLEGSKIPLFELSDLQNQWFYFGNQEKKELGIISGVGKEQSGLNKDQQEKILELLKEAALFKNVQSVEGDMIDSAPVFHYLVTLDAQGFSEFMEKLEEISQERIENQNLPIPFPKEKIDEMRESIKKIENIPIEIWIEKETYFLRKVSIDHFESDITKIDGTKGKADMLLSVEFSNINTPVNIQTPEDGQSLEQVMQNLFGKWFSQMPLLQNGGAGLGTIDIDMEKDDDGDGLTNQEELFYNTDPKNPDTDGDGYSDGDEIKNGYNPNGAGKL